MNCTITSIIVNPTDVKVRVELHLPYQDFEKVIMQKLGERFNLEGVNIEHSNAPAASEITAPEEHEPEEEAPQTTRPVKDFKTDGFRDGEKDQYDIPEQCELEVIMHNAINDGALNFAHAIELIYGRDPPHHRSKCFFNLKEAYDKVSDKSGEDIDENQEMADG